MRWPQALWGAAFVALGTFFLILPWALARWNVSPDTIEYIAIAYNWVEGQGWRCPVIYSYYLPGALPPIHGMVMRAPAISILVAPAIALGASIPQLQVFQALLSSLVAGGGVLVARRTMSLPAAVAFGIAVAWSDLWVRWSYQVMAEPIAGGALLLLIATLPWAERRVRGAAVFGGLVAVAWLARPTLSIVLGAFVAAIALTEGRRVFRSRTLWTAVVVAGALFAAANLAVRAASGFRAYAHYGLALQSTQASEASLFQRDWPGALAYLSQNAGPVREALSQTHRALLEMYFLDPGHDLLGWIALPAWIYALRRRPRTFQNLVVAISAPGFVLLVLVFFGGYAPERYALPATICLWLLSMQMLDDLSGRLAVRAGRPLLRAVAASLPLILVLGVFLFLPRQFASIGNGRVLWKLYRKYGTEHVSKMFVKVPDSICAAMDRDALVSASNPWNVYLWCGNAAVWLPPDLDSQEVLDRYLDEIRPAYLVSNPGPNRDWYRLAGGAQRDAVLQASQRLDALERREGLAVYRVIRPPPGAPRWQAPPPLIRMGMR
jgi:hypothetical protein